MMDVEALVEKYRKDRPVYERLTKKLETLLHDLLDNNDIKADIESRTKGEVNFREKLTRAGKAYSDPFVEITDLCGIRIILHSLKDVENVASIIKSEFHVDNERSIDKRDQLSPDKFGYLSQHFIVKVSDARRPLTEWASLSEIWSEVQVRTILQHAWASVEHILVYKNELDAPASLRRRLFRLSALFELADEELDHIIQERLINKNTYQAILSSSKDKNIEINIDSLKTYIAESIEPRIWTSVFLNAGLPIDRNLSGDLSREVYLSYVFGLNSIESIDHLLKQSHGWGELFAKDYSEYLIERFYIDSNSTHILSSSILCWMLVAANAELLASNKFKIEPDITLPPGCVETALKSKSKVGNG